ncbi:MarR family transcriptional regulator, partial [Streptomyces sp. SID4917]|nr:MarR family transcriptional regulator [Streptomyces sp. SID4917]
MSEESGRSGDPTAEQVAADLAAVVGRLMRRR